jgi:hypothetical protein
MRGGYGYLLLGLLIVALASTLGEVSIRSFSCKACHQRQAEYAQWMTHQLKDRNKGFSHELIACADCHIEGSPQNTILSRGRALLHAVTYLVPQIDPRQNQTTGLFYRTRIPSANCQYCHFAAIYRKTVYLKDLPKGLKEIGLVMDHRKHVVVRDNTCSKCHERFKDIEENKADKEVNYSEVNHLACDSCHTFASHDYQKGQLMPLSNTQFIEARKNAWNELTRNPRWMVAIPSEKSCRRCHNGKIHYKTKIFLSDCREGDDYKNCVKCHPVMTPEYFERYLKDRKTKTIASGISQEFILPDRHSGNSQGSTPNSNKIDRSYGNPNNRLELNFPNSTMNWSGEHANSNR